MLATMSMGAMSAHVVSMTSVNTNFPVKEIKLPEGMSKIQNIESDLLTRKIDKSSISTRTEAIAEDIVGDYVVTYSDMLHSIDNGNAAVINSSYGKIEETLIEGEYTMTFPFVYPYYDEEFNGYVYGITLMEFPVYVDGNKISIVWESYKVELGTLTLQTYNYIEEEEDIEEAEKIETEFTGSGFRFTKEQMFSVYNPGPYDKGNYFLAANASFQKVNASNAVFNTGWKSLGYGVYQDGWLMSNATRGQQTNPEWWYSVEIQQSEINENVYRIVNPYGVDSPLASQNQARNLNGSIQFNMTDPDHVYFEAVPANFVSEELNASQFYAINHLTTYVEAYGWDVDQAVELLNAYYDPSDIVWTSFKDGILTVGSKYDEATDSYTNDAMFSTPEMGLTVVPYFGSNWIDDNGKPINMECKLWFPGVYEAGVEGIEADSNAPVRYYNLQGVEVANPEKGQLLIKRQGGKASKIVF